MASQRYFIRHVNVHFFVKVNKFLIITFGIHAFFIQFGSRMIYSLTTCNVTVSVESKYHDLNSEQSDDHIFVYRVNISNQGDEPVQLLRRHWFIFDSLGTHSEVQGEGVVGEQPLLLPGESHEYVSWSPLKSDLGKMSGHYTFVNVRDGQEFVVDIPEFMLMPKYLMN